MQNNYITVTALNKYVKNQIDNDPELLRVFLKGEISNFVKHQSGHLYFTVKDEFSQIRAVMFAKTKPSIELKNGMKVYLVGRVGLYEVTGMYQIYVDAIKSDGTGDLYIAYEKLKNDLREKGYFDRKRPLPKYPKKIGVVTSKSGAVIEDIKNVIKNRYPNVEIILYPASVQGIMAKQEIVKQIEKANLKKEVDVLIVGRGGGSIEDLWAFNEKEVALAVFNSKIPIISAIGHETDYTITDFVSDKRAETPTAAAVLATPNLLDLIKRIDDNLYLIKSQVINNINIKKAALENLVKKTIVNSPNNKLKIFEERYYILLDKLNKNYKEIINYKFEKCNKLESNIKTISLRVVNEKANKFNVNISNLRNLNPLTIMEKGYSIVYKGIKVIKNKNDLKQNDEIKIRLFEGEVKAIVKE